jgi:hypothetical protein
MTDWAADGPGQHVHDPYECGAYHNTGWPGPLESLQGTALLLKAYSVALANDVARNLMGVILSVGTVRKHSRCLYWL